MKKKYEIIPSFSSLSFPLFLLCDVCEGQKEAKKYENLIKVLKKNLLCVANFLIQLLPFLFLLLSIIKIMLND